jgi:hypothetical protein
MLWLDWLLKSFALFRNYLTPEMFLVNVALRLTSDDFVGAAKNSIEPEVFTRQVTTSNNLGLISSSRPSGNCEIVSSYSFGYSAMIRN